jgi:hypothetical protein
LRRTIRFETRLLIFILPAPRQTAGEFHVHLRALVLVDAPERKDYIMDIRNLTIACCNRPRSAA